MNAQLRRGRPPLSPRRRANKGFDTFTSGSRYECVTATPICNDRRSRRSGVRLSTTKETGRPKDPAGRARLPRLGQAGSLVSTASASPSKRNAVMAGLPCAQSVEP